jgi:hypothetical protein
MFTDDELAYRTDTKLFSVMIKVRRKGQVQGFWARVEAVK